MLLRRFVYLLIAVCTPSAFAHVEHWQPKHVLIIHSYEPSYQWTTQFQQGIERITNQYPEPVKLSIEYLDTKRITSQTYLDAFKQYFAIKYDNYHFDAVLLTDDNAQRLVSHWSPNPFAGLPIIAGGVNDFSASLEHVTDKAKILYERDDIQGTLNFLDSLNQNWENLYLLTDSSHTASLIKTAFKQELETSRLADIPFTIVEGKSLENTAQWLTTLGKTDAVILSHYNTEIDKGHYYSYEQIAHTLAEKSAAPIFVFWEFYINHGVVGGVVNRPEDIGEQMAVELARSLSIDMSGLDIAHSGSRAVVEYEAFIKHNLDQELLPDDVILLNPPKSYVRDNIETIGYSLVSFFCLLAVIINQSRTINQKRELNLKSRKIVELQKKTMQVQKEMIHVLGEAIETRSGETGNHVKRVAKLSAHLGKLAGLTHREIEMLEVVSPMHDVGKISIPEAILDKPGKLTADEWEVMKTHTHAGYNLLSSSKGEMFKMAAIIAYQHHEKWDGTGYPNGLSDQQIHIFARITAIADVFDALLSVRCYKRAWTNEEVKAHFIHQAGKEFDPELTSLLIEHYAEFTAIRHCYPDAVKEQLSIAV
nr:HD domain-containing phosphohydrolase [Vibrio sinaloensis]